MGKAVLKNPRIVTVTDPIFGPRREVQADLYDVETVYQWQLPSTKTTVETFICIVGLGKPVEFVPDEEEPVPTAFRPTT